MNLIVKYSIKGSPDSSPLQNDGSALGNTGVNFTGADVTLGTMSMSDLAVANKNGVIVPAYSGISDSTYVDKIISIELPNLGGAGITNYLSIKQSNLGVQSDIIGVETLGFTRQEVYGVAPVAAYLGSTSLSSYIEYSISRNRLIIKMNANLNTFSGATLHLRITYKN